MSERTNLRQKLIHTVTSYEGTGGAQSFDFVVPDGMFMEVLGVNIYHDSSDAVTMYIHTTDVDANQIIRYDEGSRTSGNAMVAPKTERAATQLNLRDRLAGEPLRIPSRHALTITVSSTLSQGEFVTINLNYALKPYTFTNEEASS